MSYLNLTVRSTVPLGCTDPTGLPTSAPAGWEWTITGRDDKPNTYILETPRGFIADRVMASQFDVVSRVVSLYDFEGEAADGALVAYPAGTSFAVEGKTEGTWDGTWTLAALDGGHVHFVTNGEFDAADLAPRVVVTAIPFDAPGPRHTKCGDWVEGDGDGGFECKTCGPVSKRSVKVS